MLRKNGPEAGKDRMRVGSSEILVVESIVALLVAAGHTGLRCWLLSRFPHPREDLFDSF